MKKLLILFIFISNLFSAIYNLDNVPFYDYLIVTDSTVCNDYPNVTSSENNNKYFKTIFVKKIETDYKPSDTLIQDETTIYEGFRCASDKYSSIWSYTNPTYERYMYFRGDNPSKPYIKITYKREADFYDLPSLCSDIPSTPSNTMVDDYNFKTNTDGLSSCESIYNDNGDGYGFVFINPSSNPETCPNGHCYFNTPDESFCNIPSIPNQTVINNFQFRTNYDNFNQCESAYNNNGDDNGFTYVIPQNSEICTAGHCYYNLSNTANPPPEENGGDNNTTNGDADIVDEISELIPYIDDLENLQQNTINAINDNTDSLNSLNTAVNSLNTPLNNILDSVNNISLEVPSNENLDSFAQNQNAIENSLSNLSNSGLSTNQSDLEQIQDDFSNQYEDILNDSFSSYADVFGLGGFASAPAPVSFSLFGKDYTVFDVEILNPYVENIRMIFVIFAYLLGVFILFRSV